VSELNAELVQKLARLAGLELDLERARELLPALEPVFDGDAAIAKLKLGTLTAVGNPWPEVNDG
jgi:Asp-tRNA(Asn)/Glu-tRNA(Gln) amidotransferase C subunit